MESNATTLIGYTIQISRNDYDRLMQMENKAFVAGFLLGSAKPFWSVPKEKDGK